VLLVVLRLFLAATIQGRGLHGSGVCLPAFLPPKQVIKTCMEAGKTLPGKPFALQVFFSTLRTAA